MKLGGVFKDRESAGRELGGRLRRWRIDEPIVLALPRGGVPVAREVARALGAPLDVWVVRKLRVPWSPDLGLGAVAETGWIYLSPEMARTCGVCDEALTSLVYYRMREVDDRVADFRHGRTPPDVRGRTVILVDDGIATGATIRAAIQSLRLRRPSQIVVAVPAAPAPTLDALVDDVDGIVFLRTSPEIVPVNRWYEEYRDVRDDEVRETLDLARRDNELRTTLQVALK